MTEKTPLKVVCPHCGFETDNEELCRACGKVTAGNIPANKVSLVHTFGDFFSRMREKGFHGVSIDDGLKEDPWSDPGWSTLTGNIFNHEKD